MALSSSQGQDDHHGTRSGASGTSGQTPAQSSSGLRPGRQTYRAFDSASASTPAPSTRLPSPPPQRDRRERYRPSHGRDDYHGRIRDRHSGNVGGGGQRYGAGGGRYGGGRYGSSSPESPRRPGTGTSGGGGTLVGGMVGAVGEHVVMTSLGYHPDIVAAPDRHGHLHTGVGYSAGYGQSGNSGPDLCSSCASCCGWLLGGGSGSNSP